MDLTNARTITITAGKQTDGSWDWSATVDGKMVASGTGKSPDDAVDGAEQKLWPAAEEAEGESETEPTPGGVPTEKEVWANEAQKRADRKSDLANI